MDTRYYNFPSINYPSTIFAVIKKMIINVCEVLYKDEIEIDGIDIVLDKRIVRADVESGTNVTLGDAIEELGKNQINIPFTAYNIGTKEFVEDLWTYHGAAGLSSDHVYQEKVSVWPVQIPILFFSFFDNQHDYLRAIHILSKQIAITATRIDVPYFDKNKNETFSFKADVEIEILPGEKPFKYEEQKNQYEIWDLSHQYMVTFYDMYFDSDSYYPVEDASLYLKTYTDTLLSSTTTTTIPTIISSNINGGDINIPVDQDLVIEFSEPMDPNTLIYQVLPYQSITVNWNTTGNILTLHPYGDWSSGVEYSIILFNTIESSYFIQMKENFSVNFTTN